MFYILLPALLGTLIIWIGFRPRRPWAIHAHMNRIFLKMFFVIEISVAGIPLWAYISGVLFHEQLFKYSGVGFYTLVLLSISGTIYILYWGLRFSRKKNGIAVVDAAIERYRRPDEIVDGAWLPELIVNGKAYSLVYYRAKQEKDSGFIGLDQEGQVVRDETLIRKLGQCYRLATAMAYPPLINKRTSSYLDTEKMLKLLDRSLKKYDVLTQPLIQQASTQIQQLKDGLLATREYASALCKAWYLEAEWGQKHGNANLRQVRYEDVLELASQMDAYQLMTEKNQIILKGVDAAQALSQIIAERPDKFSAKFKELGALLTLLINFKKSAQIAQKASQTNPIIQYLPLNEVDLRGWRNRLEWVDKVDRKQP